MATKEEITEILIVLSASYPRFKLEKETVRAYVMFLEDLETKELKTAAKECATKRDFFPSVHELRKTVIDIRRKASQVPTAFEAWNEVINTGPEKRLTAQLVEEGYEEKGYKIVEENYIFRHPLVEKVARMLGWPSKFPTNENSLMSDRAQFLKAYDQELQKMMDYELMLPEVREYINAQRHSEIEAGNE
jgi:hypothetical protein